MSHQPQSSRFRGAFDAALQEYEKKDENNIGKTPNRHSVELIIIFLQDQAREFGDFLGSDSLRIMQSIENTVAVLCALAATSTLGDTIGCRRDSPGRIRMDPITCGGRTGKCGLRRPPRRAGRGRVSAGPTTDGLRCIWRRFADV
jgi:hypothetical protein